MLDFCLTLYYNNFRVRRKSCACGGVAQLARANGSYPLGRWFEPTRRYHFGPLVKRLRHRPFTAVTRVQISYGSPLIWEHSSAGRASALQAEGHRFEPYCSHQTKNTLNRVCFLFGGNKYNAIKTTIISSLSCAINPISSLYIVTA